MLVRRLKLAWRRLDYAIKEARSAPDENSLVTVLSMIASVLWPAILIVDFSITTGNATSASWPTLLLLIPFGIVPAANAFGFLRRLIQILSSTSDNARRQIYKETPLGHGAYLRRKSFFEYPVESCLGLVEAPNIGSVFEQSGWRPEDITITLRGEMAANAGIEGLPPAAVEGDGPKFSLARIPESFSDGIHHLDLVVAKTRFSVVKAHAAHFMGLRLDEKIDVLSRIKHEREWPDSFCLHAICETSDGYLIAEQRSPNAFYYPSAFSISFEEQLSESDFKRGNNLACQGWIRRAICEELFPQLNTYSNDPETAWSNVSHSIQVARILSIFLEGEANNVSLACYVRLKLSLLDYCSLYRKLFREGGRRDREGSLFALKVSDGAKLFGPNPTSLLHLEVDTPDPISAKLASSSELSGVVDPGSPGTLHPTSLYRLSLVLRQSHKMDLAAKR